jgi:hypothetical protein
VPKTKKFWVNTVITIDCTYAVEASSEEEARELWEQHRGDYDRDEIEQNEEIHSVDRREN